MYEKDNKEPLYLKKDFEIIKRFYTLNDIINYYNIKRCSEFNFSDNEKSQLIETILLKKHQYKMPADLGRNIFLFGNNDFFTILFSFMKNEFKLIDCQKLPELNGLFYKELPGIFNHKLLQLKFNFYGYHDIVERIKDRVIKVDYMRMSDFVKKDIILPFPYDYENSDIFLQEHLNEIKSKPRSIYVNSINGYNIAFSINTNLNYILSFMLGKNILYAPNEYITFDNLDKETQADIKKIRVRIKYTENISENILNDFCKVKQNKHKTRRPLFIY